MTTPGLHRRQALTGAAGLGLGLPVLAACSGDARGESATDPNAGDSGGSGDALASTSEIEVSGGTIFEEEKVVVTQPTEGDFKGFTAVCTHQGCLVGRVQDQQIQCPCHGSAFSIADGSVVNGPATAPLEEMGITVSGDTISLS